MKKWFRLGVWLVVSASAGWSVDWTAYKPEGYVSDFARIIDPATKARLETYCGELEHSTGAQMALVTIPSLQGEPIEEVANTLARAWGVGQKGKNQGVLLLLAIQDRRSRLEIGYGLEPILPDGLDGATLREMRPALRQGRYGEALMAAAQTVGGAIANAKHVTIQAPLPRQIHPDTTDSFPWPVVVGIVLLLLWLMRSGRPRGYGGYRRGWGGGGFLPGLILGNTLGRSTWGSRGSGGFGGYDSSDGGFGGFGGGDFGGGGASSDW